MEFKHCNLGFAHRWAVAAGRFLVNPWARAAEINSLKRQIFVLESERDLLQKVLHDRTDELKARRAAVGALVQWIKITHRLDVPPDPGTIRKMLDDAQQSKPSP